MFGVNWTTSKREYDVIVERNVKIPVSDGTLIDADIWRPKSEGKFPVIFGFHPYDQAGHTAPIYPRGMVPTGAMGIGSGREKGNASLESGDPNFYVRRGYVHVIANVRGTGKSEGLFHMMGSQEVQDGYDIIEWIAGQPWCDSNVALLGVSYFAFLAMFIAALKPPHLKCMFAMCASTDLYRDTFYHGGILGYEWQATWCKRFNNVRPYNYSKNKLGEEKYKEAIAEVLKDEDVKAIPVLVDALKNPEVGGNSLIVDLLINSRYNDYWKERTINYEDIKVPSYIGCCWEHYGFHLPAAFRSWENIDAPKKMLIGPGVFIDRPLYQLAYESLRWFDHWMKGMDTDIMSGDPIKIFVTSDNTWKETTDWPLPETRFTPFYLHEKGLLSEREHWPYEGQTSIDDSPYGRSVAEFWSPKMVEDTEVIGPMVLNMYASTTDKEALLFATILYMDEEGDEKILTRGWLRGSHRKVDAEKSKPWLPYHPHEEEEPLNPGEIYEFNIPIVPLGNMFKAGTRLGIRIASTDDAPGMPYEPTAARGHIRRQGSARVTIFHNADYPSHLLVPVTKGNIQETYISHWEPVKKNEEYR